MEYIVKTAAINGELIPLAAVAESMARAKTTAFGAAPFQQAKFDHFFREYAKLLVEEAQTGRLFVCNHLGKAMDAANIIADAEIFGEPTVMKKDGEHDENGFPVEPDWELTHLLALHVPLCTLNGWGKATGSTYVLSHEQVVWLEGWQDDQGRLTVEAHWKVDQQSQHEAQETKVAHEEHGQQPQRNAQENSISTDISSRRSWDEHDLRRLYYESLEPGMTRQKLGEKYNVSRQAITKHIKKAEGMFAPRTAGLFGTVFRRK